MTLDLHHTFTLNPDGSGRVAVRWTGPVGDGVPEPDEFVRAEIEKAQGVEAWADVTCTIDGDHTVFGGTAWFRDLRALRFHCQGVHVNLTDLELVGDADGSVELRTRLERAANDEPTSGDLAATLEAERDKLRAAREIVAGMFGGLTCTIVANLPGRLVGKVRGQRRGDTGVETTFHGAKLVELLDRLLTDDALMARLLASGGLNGPSAPRRARVPSGKMAADTRPARTRRPSSRIAAIAAGASLRSMSTCPPARRLYDTDGIHRPSERLETYFGKLEKKRLPRIGMSNML